MELRGHRKLEPSVTLSMSYRNHGHCADALNWWRRHGSPLYINLTDLGNYKAEGLEESWAPNPFLRCHLRFLLPLPCSDVTSIAHPEDTGCL